MCQAMIFHWQVGSGLPFTIAHDPRVRHYLDPWSYFLSQVHSSHLAKICSQAYLLTRKLDFGEKKSYNCCPCPKDVIYCLDQTPYKVKITVHTVKFRVQAITFHW